MVIFKEVERKYDRVVFKGQPLQEELEKYPCVPEQPSKERIGVGVDIGTTTVAICLMSERTRSVIAEMSRTNVQTKLGADVMMRIMHAVEGREKQLHQMIVEQVEAMTKQCMEEAGLFEKYQSGQLEVCFFVVGNTAMSHLFLKKRVKGLGGYPFQASYYGNVRTTGEKLDMQLFAKETVCVLSGIAAHVGGDALAVIGASGIDRTDKIQLAVDLGTNAEIILNNKGKLSVCSAAAGPAFEGKGIRCGVRAKRGAVCGVHISPGNGNIILEYIAGGNAAGICGSGLVDALAQLKKCKLMKEDGYLLSRSEAAAKGIFKSLTSRLERREGETVFCLCSEQEQETEIILTQSDIRSMQLAKGAIQAGVCSLLENSGISLSQVDEVVVAGALGNYLRPANAEAIGLLPGVEEEKLRFVGNAALEGTELMFFDSTFCERMERLAGEIEHLELAQYPLFQSMLMKSMYFQKV